MIREYIEDNSKEQTAIDSLFNHWDVISKKCDPHKISVPA